MAPEEFVALPGEAGTPTVDYPPEEFDEEIIAASWPVPSSRPLDLSSPWRERMAVSHSRPHIKALIGCLKRTDSPRSPVTKLPSQRK